jgi:predicted nucleotidyltransferase
MVMEAMNKTKLEKRNQRIIQAVIKKIENHCPGSVDLIGIGGSFFFGDIHEKSDLDLLIVINDDKARSISSCFVLDGVGFDIYCSKWSRLEHMAEYKDPYSGKLVDLEIVYVLNKKVEERYYSL